MEHIEELIRKRRSVRTFDGRALSKEDLEKLSSFMSKMENPYGIKVVCKLLDGKEQKLGCPVVSGTDLKEDFNTPLMMEQTDALAYPLEMLRWAPSAVNKQPWRVIVAEKGVHFYLRHNKGFKSKEVGDMQKIDMGIALCHFALAAEEKDLKLQFCINDPEIPAEEDTEYIASYLFA